MRNSDLWSTGCRNIGESTGCSSKPRITIGASDLDKRGLWLNDFFEKHSRATFQTNRRSTMIHQHTSVVRGLLIGTLTLFPWCGIIGVANAETSLEESTGERVAPSAGKRQGQSPSNKSMSTSPSGNTKTHGAASVGKRQGQSPANKRATKPQSDAAHTNDDPSGDKRQGQSPGY